MDQAERIRRNECIWSDRWYKAYWRLKAWLAVASGFGHPGTSLIDSLLTNPSRFQTTVRDQIAANSNVYPSFVYPGAFLDEGSYLAEEVRAAVNADQPKENVYQAAICAMTDWGWDGNHMHENRVFRGESDFTWSSRQFCPTIFRGKPDADELKRRRRELDVAAYWFKKRQQGRNDSSDELLAIFQHYGLRTWLLDATTSIYVALFFASLIDEKEEVSHDRIGAVYAYSMKELNEYHQLAPDLVPPYRQIKPQFVPRIDRQHGLFLVGGHGWSARHLVFQQLTFKQVPSMCFEDSGLGISKHYLLSSEGDWSWFDSSLQYILFAIRPQNDSQVLAEETALSRLLEKHEIEIRDSLANAPILDVEMTPRSDWPPPLEPLRRCAERCLEKAGLQAGDRRTFASSALARYHQLLCVPSCGYLLGSLHAFIYAAVSIGQEMTRNSTVEVVDIQSRYVDRASPNEFSLLSHAMCQLQQELGRSTI